MEDYITLSDARFQCNIRSTELASVHSDEEMKFISDHIKTPTFNGWWWIGLVRLSSSKWFTVTAMLDPHMKK